MNRTVVLLTFVLLLGCRGEPAPSTGSTKANPNQSTNAASAGNSATANRNATAAVTTVSAEQAAEIDTFCMLCHANPRADYFPKHAWHDEVERAFGFFVDSGRTDVKAPPIATVVRYYAERAPEKLEFPLPVHSTHPIPVRFERAALDRAASKETPTIGNLRWTTLAPAKEPVFVVCDMRGGDVRLVDPRQPDVPVAPIASCKHPCRAEPCDLDGDGATDLLVADLGTFEARDVQTGRVLWVRQQPATGQWQTIELLTGVGRISDVRAADFDADGDLDLLVSEFGWHKTGSVFWLENQGGLPEKPQFARHDIDSRPGGIHLPIIDLNRDGKPDFLALMSQDYEEVLAWINRGDGTFEKQIVSERQEPSFGSSGIELVDLDGDGDLDLLYTNGDTFDSRQAKPYHGVQWLENTGGYPYKLHRLADMIGCYRALAADFDHDGDLDIVAGAFLPNDLLDEPPLTQHDSLILLEQTAPGRFERHAITQGEFNHASLEVADFDGDGRADVAAGIFLRHSQPSQPRVIVWWNRPTR